ncbi:MAG: UMP kinase [Candidatus Avilachnospira sp.]|jgi:uridylate kinase
MTKSRRVMLKLSGEALAGTKHMGFDEETVKKVALQVKASVDSGVQVAIVIGGGNFWRGRSNKAFDRVKADQIGMLATVMNCIYVSEIFRTEGMDTKVFCAFDIPGMVDVFDKDKAVSALEEGKVVFFAGGTGHPYFSTDTGIALRAIEIEADSILLAKAVDGVYDSDPRENPNAKKFDKLSITEVVERKLQVIDMTASILCMENHMPLAVFSLNKENSITDALNGKIDGTVITA